jgi:hypothetical protein
MVSFAILLIVVACISLAVSYFKKSWRTFLLVTSAFAVINSVIAAPLNWMSLLKGYGFRLNPIASSSPPVPVAKLVLPMDSPEVIIQKMGCHVCHKIPHIPVSRDSTFGPILIEGTMARIRIASPEYLERVKAGKAGATTPREYVIESILDPSAFILSGFEKKENPHESLMYPHYSYQFTREGLENLVKFLLTLDVKAAADEGLMFAH